MITIYLIRHAEAEGNLYRLMHGVTDSDLTDLGRKQAAKLGERFRSIPLDAVWSSPLRRTMLTAAELCLPKKLPLHTDRRLMEVNVGVWEGIPFGNAQYENPDQMELFYHDPPAWQVEGSDAICDLGARGAACLSELAQKYHEQGKEAGRDLSIAVCAHGYLINSVMCALFYGYDSFLSCGVSYNTAVTTLRYDPEQALTPWKIVSANDFSHLSDPSLVRIRKTIDGRRPDLRFEPFGSDIDTYIRYRGDAWELIYGSKKDFNGSGFWLDAQKTMGQDPRAILHGSWGRTPVGILQLSPDRNAAKGAGYIPFIYLREPFRNKGLGIQFIGQAVDFYRGLGRKKLQLSVAHTNEAALAFYRKFGFYEAGKTPGRYGKLILMEKDIRMEPLPKQLRIISE